MGENTTLIVQVEPAARVMPQLLLVILNWLVTDMRLIASAAVPVFDKVNGTGVPVVPLETLPKLLEVGVRVVAGWPPVPVKVMIAGLATSEVLTTTVPVATPVVVGENLTLKVQLLPAFREPPIGQFVESWKGPV